MDSWGVFLAIGELVAFLILVAKPLINLTTTLTKLNVTVENLQRVIKDNKENSRKTHQRLWEYNEKQDKIIDGHEIRITKLEEKEKRDEH